MTDKDIAGQMGMHPNSISSDAKQNEDDSDMAVIHNILKDAYSWVVRS